MGKSLANWRPSPGAWYIYLTVRFFQKSHPTNGPAGAPNIFQAPINQGRSCRKSHAIWLPGSRMRYQETDSPTCWPGLILAPPKVIKDCCLQDGGAANILPAEVQVLPSHGIGRPAGKSLAAWRAPLGIRYIDFKPAIPKATSCHLAARNIHNISRNGSSRRLAGFYSSASETNP